MLSAGWREGVSKEKAAVGDSGEAESMFAAEAFRFLQGAGGTGGGGEEFE